MQEAVLILAVAGFFWFGYLIVKRLDRFLNADRKMLDTRRQEETQSPKKIDAEASDLEILREIGAFRKEHRKTGVLLYDEEEQSQRDAVERMINGKR